MSSKFFFFTDPSLLQAQAPADAFGPAAASGGMDRFQAGDFHTAAVGAPVYAACRGRVCFQAVVDGSNVIQSLNIILAPLTQPPFSFPYVEYFIYRGVAPTSVLTATLDKVELLREGTSPDRNDQIGYLRDKVLKLAAPSASTPEPLAYLGLDRVATTATDGGVFGDGHPLDHLFRYPAGAELPIVEAGWKLGEFLARFGFEVVVQSYGSQPKISWARAKESWIEADPIPSGTLPAVAYPSRLRRESIGCFVDPCAFWGMFWNSGLGFRAAGSTSSSTAKKTALCSKIFAPGGIFKNAARTYLSLKNDAGLSYDFYGTYSAAGNNLSIGSAQNIPGDILNGTYGTDGWPLHVLDGPSNGSLWLKFATAGNLHPTLYLQQAGSDSPPNAFVDGLVPLNVRKPGGNGSPPWWHVIHVVRGIDMTNPPVPASGVFDTSSLQCGPISDRVLAAASQFWSAPRPATGYKRTLVSDKVVRYDGTIKTDPADPLLTLAYAHMGDTIYIFQRGATASQDSVIVFQRPDQPFVRDYGSKWTANVNYVRITSSATDLLFDMVLGRSLASPVFVSAGSGGTYSVPSFLELLSVTPTKRALFHYTFVCLSRPEFEFAMARANPVGPTPSSGEKHPAYLTIAPTLPVAPADVYQVSCTGWSGSADNAAVTPVLTVDGIFLSSNNFDRASLAHPATAYTPNFEENFLAGRWKSYLDQDKPGATATVDAFLAAVLATDGGGDPDPGPALASLVETYGRQIWNDAVALASDAAFKSADQILYCARAKMEVTLKSHSALRADGALSEKLVARFEALSRNYAGLDFQVSDVTPLSGAPRKPVIATGFDPFESGGDLATNPSGSLALYLAAHPVQSFAMLPLAPRDFVFRTCIFPVRWDDFDKQVVETTLERGVLAATTGIAPRIVCTVSLNRRINTWVDTHLNAPIDFLYLQIDGFPARARDDGTDNLNESSLYLDPLTLPTLTSKAAFYQTRLDQTQSDLSVFDAALRIKIRYATGFWGTTSAGVDQNHLKTQGDTWLAVSWPSSPTPMMNTYSTAIEGSGGAYLSNEMFYRSSNLIQSVYPSIRNGHLHIPLLGDFKDGAGHTVTVSVADLAKSVVTVLDGVQDP